MKIVSAEYLLTAVNAKQYPDDELPEIAMAGRSNVGKSSMINKLCNRRAMARTSSTPGKTRTLNFYQINANFRLVDVPGYGYAKVGREMRRSWDKMIEAYLLQRRNLLGVVQIIDLRHPPMESDMLMFDWLFSHGLSSFIVANKADKLSKNAQVKNLKIIRENLRLPGDFPIIAFSGETGQGVEQVWIELEKLLTEHQEQPMEG